MLKKTLLTFAFLIVITTFYGFNARYGVPVVSLDSGATAYSNPLLREGDYVISAYDAIIRNISEREGNDWRLMSAVAYHESRFRADLVSRRGARGLMQIMPSVARQFRIPVERAVEPESMSGWLISCGRVSNSRCGCRSIPRQDRIAMILASYNGGLGHVKDARRLARYYGENPDSWEVVARYLVLISQPEYYNNEVIRCGRFTGSRFTLAYVDDVLGRYEKYCRMAER